MPRGALAGTCRMKEMVVEQVEIVGNLRRHHGSWMLMVVSMKRQPLFISISRSLQDWPKAMVSLWPASIWICFAPEPFAERKSGIKCSTSYKKHQLIVDANQEFLQNNICNRLTPVNPCQE